MDVETLRPGWATYLRVSDEDKQHPERSFAFQRQRIQEHLLSDTDLPHIREYRDKLTGKNPRRADYQQLLADAAAGSFSHLGLYRADRFGRDTMEGLQAATTLIGLGVKIRVSHMPSLQPEEPDGFFMFLLQMGMAQREVDVLSQRALDGIEAKLRAGGWPFNAPDGYVNKEEPLGGGKYNRWIELDPQQGQVWRDAWDLLLTDRYTLDEICDELHARGYTRRSGKPWVWADPKSGGRRTAANKLSRGFHRPLYAGWAVSERFGIEYGQIRGNWEPVVTSEEFERGLQILAERNERTYRKRRHTYLLKGLLMIRVGARSYRTTCSTPSGRNASYSYYVTRAKPGGKKQRLACEVVDDRIPEWLQGIAVDPSLLADIRDVYREDIRQAGPEHSDRRQALQERVDRLRDEEADLARLLVTGKLSEEAYDRLRKEWQGKLFKTKHELDVCRQEAAKYLDDLDVALVLLAQAPALFRRMAKSRQATLLQILAKRIIVNTHGEIVDCELHSPFAYLTTLTNGVGPAGPAGRGSDNLPLPLLG